MALALALALAPPPAGAEVLSLTHPEAVALARAAWMAGNAALANAIARHLLAADPEDVEALMLLAASAESLGDPQAALAAGRRAWAAARAQDRPAELRWEIARQIAHAAVGAGREGLAGLWLRRSIDAAPAAAERDRSRQDLALVQAHQPLRFAAGLQISPTNNLNGGASTGLFVVDGATIGTLDGWSVAHEGVIVTTQIDATLNLGAAPDGAARTELNLGVMSARHFLSAEEARANPDLDASELDMLQASLGLYHERAGRAPGARLGLGLEAGQSWYDLQPHAPVLRLTASSDLAPRGAWSLGLEALVERQWQPAPDGRVTGASLGLAAQRPAPGWAPGQMGLDLTLTGLAGPGVNNDWAGLEIAATYEPAARLGPLGVTLGLGASLRDYPRYQIIEGAMEVTKGRTDQGLWAQVSFGLPDLTLGGLTPTLAIAHSVNLSNISKYESEQTSLSLGLSADF